MAQNWERLESKDRGDFTIYRIREDQCRSPRTGARHRFFVLESADWVNVVPITPTGQIVCIRQWRPGTNALELEIPGGIVDAGETPEDAARRELLEETGFTSNRLTPLGSMSPNPAMLDNRCHFFVAHEARPTQTQNLDSGEDISVTLVDLDEVPRLVRKGEINHGIIIAAFYYLSLHKQELG